MIEILKLDRKFTNTLAEILSTDSNLHKYLSPNHEMLKICGEEYYNACLEWEEKREGNNFCILYNKYPIGSISYTRKNNKTAGAGMWIASKFWNIGLGTQILSEFKKIVKDNNYSYLVATIQKWNPRSKRMCEKCGATFTEEEEKWCATFIL